MDTKMYWKGLGILGVALLGTATVFYQLGKKDIQTNISEGGNEKIVDSTAPTPVNNSETRLYRNDVAEFAVSIPKTWRYAVQNAQSDWQDIFLYDEKYETDVRSDSNVLLALINKKIPYISLNVNGSDFVKQENFNIKDKVVTPAGGPNGTFERKLLSWTEEATDTKQKLFVYTVEIQQGAGSKEYGVVWVANGKLFTLKSENPENQAKMESIAKSFTLTTPATQGLMYKNSDFGTEFMLSLPESWKGYVVEKDGTMGIRFYLPSAKYASVLKYQTNRVPVLFIEAAPKAKIDNLSSQCSHASTLSADDQYACNWLPVPGKSYYLGKNSQYYFSFRGPVGEPTINIDDFPVKTSPELTVLEKETKAVVDSFQSQ